MLRVAAVQLPDVQGDIPQTLRVIRNYLIEAEAHKANIICFPECFLQGYTLDKKITAERAIDLASKEFEAIVEQLAGFSPAAIIGLIEKDGDEYFNAAVLIQDGAFLGKYRKTHVFEENFRAGDAYPVFDVEDTKVGINICYDARFADGASALVHAGAEVIFYPLNNKLPIEKAVLYRDEHLTNLITRAKETKRWVVAADVIAQTDTETGYGCTAIVSPDGKVVAQVEQLQTGMITADIA